MKILQVNCVYNVGSTGKIVFDLARYLKAQGHESVVCYGRGKRTPEPNVYKVSSEIEAKVHSVFSRAFGVEFAHSPLATNKLLKIIENEKPDVVHLHCLNGHFVNVYRLLEYLKRKRVKTVLTLHAELMHTAGCGYALECEKWKTECSHCSKVRGKISRYFRDDAKYCFHKMKDALDGFDTLQLVGCSDWITNRAKLSPITASLPIRTIHNGIDTEIFKSVDARELRKKLEVPTEKKIVLYVTPSFTNPIKGGKYLLECAQKLSEYQFIIVGFDGDKTVLTENVLSIPFTSGKREMAQYYSLADCLLMTSLRENYPTVCVEATACGTPVVGFDVGGVRETIPEGMGEYVEAFDISQTIDAVKKWINVNISEEMKKKANTHHSKTRMCEQYLQAYGLS